MEGTTAMTWGKIVLVFQAVITLMLGIVFFLQITTLDENGIQEIRISLSEQAIADGNSQQAEENIIEVSKRFEIAGYVLLIVSLIEILIISRFIS